MRTSICAFALGIWACQQLPSLPPIGGGLGVAFGLVLLAASLYLSQEAGARRRLAVAILALAAGFAWAVGRAEWRLADELPREWEGRDVFVTGIVADLPQPVERGARFVLEVEKADGPVPRRIQLSWTGKLNALDGAPTVHAGERWRLKVRLRRPHGQANPHGFDFEAWLLERNVRATGSVRADPGNALLDEFVPGPMVSVHRLRESVRERFQDRLSDAPYAGVLIALAIGDQRAIPREQWEVFRRTGVTHLISISGLHVTMVAMLAATLIGWLWRRRPALLLRVPARKAAAAGGFVMAWAYALLAGFGIPTQRTFIMLGVVAIAMLLGREALGSRVLVLALLAVLLADPWAVLSPGFWLSFGAVGIILYVLGGRAGKLDGWRAALVTQLAITLAMIPALLVLFSAFSLISPVANALAIPLVSFVITPLALIAIIIPFGPLLDLGHWITALMMACLEWLSAVPMAIWQQANPPFALAVVGMLGAAWLLLPRGTPARLAGALAMLPMLAWTPSRPAHGEFRATVLDVGQGTAVHVQTRGRDLVFDTGPAYGPETDAGQRVLLPYLTASGVDKVDRVVISHDDADHSGGAASLFRGIPVNEVLSPMPAAHPLLAASGSAHGECAAGARWNWDGVDFEILYPVATEKPVTGRDNDESCVLRIAAPGGSVLLAGDIEAASERRLIERHGEALSSSVIVVPHHGSRSSSTPAFVREVGAHAAIFSVGHLNQFRHPHPSVVERWEGAGARSWRTDRQGAIHVTVGAHALDIETERSRRGRYWHGR